MTNGRPTRSMAILGGALQLGSLALLAFVLFIESKPPDNPSGQAGTMFPRPDDWVFPYSIALATVGVASLFSRRAAPAAALLTTVAIAMSFGFGDRDGFLASPYLAGLALVSLIGWALRATNTPPAVPPRNRLSSARRSGR